MPAPNNGTVISIGCRLRRLGKITDSSELEPEKLTEKWRRFFFDSGEKAEHLPDS